MGRSKHPFKSSIMCQVLLFYLCQSPPLHNIWPSKLSMRRTTQSASCGNGLPRPSSWRTMWNLHPAAAEAAPHVSRRELMWSGTSGGGSSSSRSSGTSSPPPTTERHPSSFVLVVDMASKTTTIQRRQQQPPKSKARTYGKRPRRHSSYSAASSASVIVLGSLREIENWREG